MVVTSICSTLLRDLADSDNEDCSGVTGVPSAGKKPISIILSLRCGQILAPRRVAYDPEYSRFSPGIIQLLSLFKEAVGRGVEMVDLGYGQDSYKERFRNATYSRERRRMGRSPWVSGPFGVSKGQVPRLA
jgi:CelD/BcsL family acetyltransferase involved in cellulose biosynthesis